MERKYGDKYEAGLSVVGIAKRYRSDLKAAIKAGTLPAGIKCSVVTRNHRSINVEVLELPTWFRLTSGEWGRDGYAQKSRESIELVQLLRTMLDAYNYDGSDIMRDYFDVNFYSSVTIDPELRRATWDRSAGPCV